MGSAWKIILLMVTYVIFCKKIGPIIMDKRQPFDLKGIMTFYNIFQIFINLYLFTKVRLVHLNIKIFEINLGHLENIIINF